MDLVGWNRGTMTAFSPTMTRSYRGEATDGESKLSVEEQKLYNIAKPRSDVILAKHHSIPDISTIPLTSFDRTTTAAAMSNDSDMNELILDIRRKRLLYRSKQRGWLEVDLLLGTWTNANIDQLNLVELDQLEDFINYETIDIYNIITLRLDVPDHLKTPDGSGIVERIQQWARTSPLGKADPDKYKQMKQDAKLI